MTVIRRLYFVISTRRFLSFLYREMCLIISDHTGLPVALARRLKI